MDLYIFGANDPKFRESIRAYTPQLVLLFNRCIERDVHLHHGSTHSCQNALLFADFPTKRVQTERVLLLDPFPVHNPSASNLKITHEYPCGTPELV